MENEKKKSIIDLIWDVFASVKTAVVIFILIAATSMVGTVIEQNADPQKNLKILAKFFGESSAPAAYQFFEKLGFMNMYHSWWFLTFLLLFSINLIVCSLDRLPRIWKLVKEPVRPLDDSHLEKMSIRHVLTLKGKFSDVKAAAETSLKAVGFTPSQADEGKTVKFFAEHGNYSRLGVYITHLSILVILAGALAGTFFGFTGWLPLAEGETTSVIMKNQQEQIPLGFEIRCDNFEVEYYGESDMPKAYKSWLSVFKNGRKVKDQVISVNTPLTYEGVTFYQSSYGAVPESQGKGIVILKAVSNDGKSQELNLKIGDSFEIPGSQVKGVITDFSPALSFDSMGKPFTYDEEHIKNPAIKVEFNGMDGKGFSGWILKRFPQTWNLPDGSRLEFHDYWGVEYTGMQVRKDPGVWIVYLGCIIMAAGLYMTFFMSHRRLWLNVTEEKGSVRVVVGGSANRNRVMFEKKLEKLVGLLNAGRKGDK